MKLYFFLKTKTSSPQNHHSSFEIYELSLTFQWSSASSSL